MFSAGCFMVRSVVLFLYVFYTGFLHHSKNPCSKQVSKLWLLFAEAALTYGKFHLDLTSNPTNNWYCLHVSIICRHVNHNLFSISFVFSTQHAFHFYRWINCHNTLLWSHILSKLGAGSKSWWKLPGFTPPPQGVSESAIFFSWRMLTRKLLFFACMAWRSQHAEN